MGWFFMKSKRIVYLAVCICLGLLFSILSLNSGIAVASMAKNFAAYETVSPTIIIDPGHGGEDGGASSASGLLEKDLNLSISLYLKSFLEQSGFKVSLIRDGDYAVYDESASTLKEKKTSDLKNRLKICNSSENNIYISIHQNKFPQSKYSGGQVFYGVQKADYSRQLAQQIQTNFKELLQPQNTRQIKEAYTTLYLMQKAPMPAVLVECGFLSNPEEAHLLITPEYQRKIAFVIFGSTLQFLEG